MADVIGTPAIRATFDGREAEAGARATGQRIKGDFESSNRAIEAQQRQASQRIQRLVNDINAVRPTRAMHELEVAIKQVGGQSALSEQQVARLRAQVERLTAAGARLPATLSRLQGSGTSALGAAGTQLAGSLSGNTGMMGATLMSLGPAGLAAAAGIGAMVAAATAGVSAIAHLAAEAERLQNRSLSSGFGVEAVQVFERLAENAGLSGDAVFRAVTRMQVAAVNGSAGFRALGLSSQEFLALRPEDQLQQVAEKIMAIEEPAKRTAAAVGVFGRSGAELIPVLASLADGSANLAVTLSADQVAALNNLDNALDKVGGAWTDLKNQMVAQIASSPDVRAGLDLIADGLIWLATTAKDARLAVNLVHEGLAHLTGIRDIGANVDALTGSGPRVNAVTARGGRELERMSRGPSLPEIAPPSGSERMAEEQAAGRRQDAVRELDRVRAEASRKEQQRNAEAQRQEQQAARAAMELEREAEARREGYQNQQRDAANAAVEEEKARQRELAEIEAERFRVARENQRREEERIEQDERQAALAAERAEQATRNRLQQYQDIASIAQSISDVLGSIVGQTNAWGRAAADVARGLAQGAQFAQQAAQARASGNYAGMGAAAAGSQAAAYQDNNVWSAAGQGAQTGAEMGGPIGAIIGGTINGLTSVFGQANRREELLRDTAERFGSIAEAQAQAARYGIDLMGSGRVGTGEALTSGSIFDAEAFTAALEELANTIQKTENEFQHLRSGLTAAGTAAAGLQQLMADGLEDESGGIGRLIGRVAADLLSHGIGVLDARLSDNEEFGRGQQASSLIQQLIAGMTEANSVDVSLLADATAATATLIEQQTQTALDAGLSQEEATRAGFGANAQLLQAQLEASMLSGEGTSAELQALLDEARANGINIVASPLVQSLEVQRESLLVQQKMLAALNSSGGQGVKPESMDLPPVSAAGGLGVLSSVRMSGSGTLNYHPHEWVYSGSRGGSMPFRSGSHLAVLPASLRRGGLISAAEGFGDMSTSGGVGWRQENNFINTFNFDPLATQETRDQFEDRVIGWMAGDLARDLAGAVKVGKA